jgi:hypothetical protein
MLENMGKNGSGKNLISALYSDNATGFAPAKPAIKSVVESLKIKLLILMRRGSLWRCKTILWPILKNRVFH